MSSIVNSNRIKVTIAGGGPAGLMTAHALLSRGDQYEVSVFESSSDPRFVPPGPRAYSLGLNIRGQYAIKYFQDKNRCLGLWDAIAKRGVESDSFFLHIGSSKIQIRKPVPPNLPQDPNDPPPTLLIQRNELCSAMLIKLLEEYGDSGRLNVTFDNKVTDVDLKSQVAFLNSGDTVEYDLLVGSDGVKSVVRKAMSDERNTGFYAEEVLLPGIFKVMVQDCPKGLENDAVHAIEGGKNKARYGLFLIPTTENRMCSLVTTRSGLKNKVVVVGNDAGSLAAAAADSELPTPLQQFAAPDEIQKDIEERYPVFGKPSREAALQLLAQQPSEVRTVRCNRYHASNIKPENDIDNSSRKRNAMGGVILLGDSAHSTGGSLGQGANSALLDIVALDKCLDEAGDNLHHALSLFSERQVPEGLALWQLLQLPPKGPIGVIYRINQFLLGFLYGIKAFRKFIPRPTQSTVSQTLTSFSEIVRQNSFWVKLATGSFRQIHYTPETIVA